MYRCPVNSRGLNLPLTDAVGFTLVIPVWTTKSGIGSSTLRIWVKTRVEMIMRTAPSSGVLNPPQMSVHGRTPGTVSDVQIHSLSRLGLSLSQAHHLLLRGSLHLSSTSTAGSEFTLASIRAKP